MRWLLVACVVAASCSREVRRESTPRQLWAGIAESFVAPTSRRWAFGDGAFQSGQSVRHAFATAGRYEVQAFEGNQLAEVMMVEVQPYASHRSLVAGANWVLSARTFEAVGTFSDALERLTSARRANAVIDQSPLAGLALEAASEKTSALDPIEGLTLASYGSALLTVVGCSDEAGAVLRAREVLALAGWGEGDGLYRRDDVVLRLFARRGHLMAVSGSEIDEVEALATRLGSVDGRGLEGLVPAGAWAAVQAAPVVVWAQANVAAAKAVLVGVRLEADVLDVEGYALAEASVWAASEASAVRFLEGAPAAPVAVLAIDVAGTPILDALLGPVSSARRDAFEARWLSHWGFSPAQVASALEGAQAAAYFDARGFYRSVIEGEGRPRPRGTLLLQAAHHDRNVLERGLRSLFAELKLEGMASLSETALALFRGRVDGQPFEMALSDQALFAKAGTPLDAPGVDVREQISQRLPGAFAPGHVSVFVDVERLKEDFKTPVSLPGVDPRRLIAAQAFTSTFVEQLTALKWAIGDVAPDPLGARLRLRIATAPKEKR